MKLKMDAKLLTEMVSTAAQAISSKPMLPAYECLYIRVTSESGSPIMSVMGKDTGMAIMKATDKIVAMEDGEALVPAKTFLAFMKLMNGELTLNADGKKCQIKCGGKNTTIACMDVEDYSSDFTALTNEKCVKMDGDAFSQMVESVIHCIDESSGRVILTGVNFAFSGSEGKCEATGLDGFRMAIAARKAETNDDFNVTIPASASKLIAKTINGGKDVSFRFGNGVVIVDDYDTSIEASMLAGEYMDTKRLKVTDGKMQVRVNVPDMMEAVKLARISSSTGAKDLILLNFEKPGMMRVTANSEKSQAVTDVYCDVNGEMGDGSVKEIAFNGRYVEEALKVSADYAGEATLLINTTVSPMAVLPIDRDDYYQLVLPVRRLGKD